MPRIAIVTLTVCCLTLISFDPQLGLAQSPVGPASESVTNGIGMQLKLIPPGEFMMGTTPAQLDLVESFDPAFRKDGSQDEQPQHRVRISKPFYLGVYEVTKGQFAQFVLATGYQTDAEKDGQGGWGWNETKERFEGRLPQYNWHNAGFTQPDDHPVGNISWNDAVAFCKWISEKEGKDYRLPTEAEWEYACRAGTSTLYSNGDDPERLVEVANVADATAKPPWKHELDHSYLTANDGFVFSSPVGSFKPNPFGLYDMHGGVWEWCADHYAVDAYQGRAGVTTDPLVLEGDHRVRRGGCWVGSARIARSSDRYGDTTDNRDLGLGFRVARAP